ncbi:unnamed protein product [Withania somnifera]
MPNGSHYEWLHLNEDNAKILDFPRRVKIALGIAKGLAWLHHCYELHVTHGSMSTRCILLDQNPKTKISNFWSSYKQDIYCFGVVLLEQLTGKEPHELTSSTTYLITLDGLILQFLKLACKCVKFFPNERPTMLEVYDILKNISQGRRDWIQKVPLSTDISSLYD